MKPFTFSLHRIRDYKTQVRDAEQSTLTRLRRERDDTMRRLADTRDYIKTQRQRQMRLQEQGVTMVKLQMIAFLIETARRQIPELEQAVLEAQEAFEAQTDVVISVNREISGYDKLEEKQLAEYQYLSAKEVQNQILEQVSLKLHRGIS